MNKGLEIRNRKLQKNARKRNRIKESQLHLVRFIKIKWIDIQRVNGKYRPVGTCSANGLQIKNRVYLENGHYKLINSHSVKILKTYKGVPEWATESLIEKYSEATKAIELQDNICT